MKRGWKKIRKKNETSLGPDGFEWEQGSIFTSSMNLKEGREKNATNFEWELFIS